jgi:phage antirepressor YoqD-like protein
MDLQDELEKQVEIRLKAEIEKLADNPDAVIAAYAKKLEQTERAMEYLRQELQPKADFYDTVTQSDDWAEMSQVSKLIAVKGWGRNKVFSLLRERGILRYNNEPYQQYVERGYFKVVEQYVYLPNMETLINKKTVVSQKGIDFVRKIIMEE